MWGKIDLETSYQNQKTSILACEVKILLLIDEGNVCTFYLILIQKRSTAEILESLHMASDRQMSEPLVVTIREKSSEN